MPLCHWGASTADHTHALQFLSCIFGIISFLLCSVERPCLKKSNSAIPVQLQANGMDLETSVKFGMFCEADGQ
jgi:hypothetical protein